MTELAIKKLEKELKEFKGGQCESLIHKEVAKALMEFCRQDSEFAQAVYQNDKTLSDCMKEVVKGTKTVLSDLEAYKRAAAFYFPGADIAFSMKINLCASVEKPKKAVEISLDDLLDI